MTRIFLDTSRAGGIVPMSPDTTRERQAMTAAEKNDHYGMLNGRFDNRADFLRDNGFKYEQVPGLNIAVFTKSRFGRVLCLPAALVMNADSIVWADRVEEVERFCK